MIDPAAHTAEIEAWRAERYAALQRETGWLTLAGLGWLKPGPNRVGTAADVDVRLPDGPSHVGTITVTETGARADGGFLHAGEPTRDLDLVTDAAGEPTQLEVGALRMCLIERGGRLAVRTWDLASPAREAFDGIDHWAIDRRWRLEARFEKTPGRTLTVPDVLGFVEEEASPGDVVFRLDGVEHRLQALPSGPSGEMWLVFGDVTNGHETYGGGRFLYTDAPDGDGRVIVDFNRAYNPPCVFSPFATCPLPWPSNRLAVRVEAGEQAYGSEMLL
ncbi:MAG TPA: DUF1684 domain-containing protein [Candidatus Limnocylindria bacterium]